MAQIQENSPTCGMKFIMGKNRATYSLTEPLEQLVSPDNVVRRIDLFVEALDLAPLDFDD